jgi:hypothetical protein
VTGVTPQQVGKLVVDPGEVSFALHPDEKVQPATVRVVNEGDGPLTIARVDIARGAGNFGWTKQCDSEKVIAAHDECRFTVYPTVRQVGLWAGTLVVSSHEGAQEIQLSANVQPRAVAGISVSPDRLYAINVSGVDAQKFRSKLRDVALVQSTGSAALVITDIRFESPWFRLVDSSDACPQGLAIEAGTRCTIRVAYTGSEGKTSSRMLISDNAANTPHAVELVGIGFTAAPRGSLAIDGSGEFGTATVQGPVLYSLAHTVPQGSKIVLRNAGDGPLTLRGIRASGDSSSFGQISGCTFPVTLARGGTCEMSFRFAPVRASELVATYVVENDGSNPTESFRLHGVGVSASPPPAPPSHLGVAVAAGSTVVKKEMKRVRVQEVVPPPPPTVR